MKNSNDVSKKKTLKETKKLAVESLLSLNNDIQNISAHFESLVLSQETSLQSLSCSVNLLKTHIVSIKSKQIQSSLLELQYHSLSNCTDMNIVGIREINEQDCLVPDYLMQT